MLCLASSFTVETLSGLSAPLTENRTENQAHTHTESGPASVVVTDGSDLFPLRGLEHQMVNVAGVALHHLGNDTEKRNFNGKQRWHHQWTVKLTFSSEHCLRWEHLLQTPPKYQTSERGESLTPNDKFWPMCSRCCITLTSCLSWRSEVSKRSFLSAAAVHNLQKRKTKLGFNNKQGGKAKRCAFFVYFLQAGLGWHLWKRVCVWQEPGTWSVETLPGRF